VESRRGKSEGAESEGENKRGGGVEGAGGGGGLGRSRAIMLPYAPEWPEQGD
jgi:hypothetical protein